MLTAGTLESLPKLHKTCSSAPTSPSPPLRHGAIDHYHEKASTFFIGLAYGLGRKQRPVVDPI